MSYSVKKLRSSELKGAILGMVLGDAYMDTTHNHCRLDIYVKGDYKDFAIMKRDILLQVGGLELNFREKIDKRPLKNGGFRRGWRIQTRIHPYLTKIKNIPLFRKPEMLNELGLAIWYMDDGSLSIRKNNGNFAGCYLATNRYPLEFVEHCQRVLFNKFGVESNIQLHSPRHISPQYMLRFDLENTKKLHNIVSPYVVPSMRHKLLEEHGDRFATNL